jgi:hypothetical protein
MSEDTAHEITTAEAWELRYDEVALNFAVSARALGDSGLAPRRPVLSRLLAYTAAKLFDQGFERSEIEEAFRKAPEQLTRWAKGGGNRESDQSAQ